MCSRGLYLGLGILLSISIVAAFPASGGNYTVEKTSTLITSATASGGDYTTRAAFTDFTGINNVVSNIYSAYIGVYNYSYIVPTSSSEKRSSPDNFELSGNSTYIDSSGDRVPISIVGVGNEVISPEGGAYYICNEESSNTYIGISITGYKSPCGDTSGFIKSDRSFLLLHGGACGRISITLDYPSGCTELFSDQDGKRFGIKIEGDGDKIFIPVESLSPANTTSPQTANTTNTVCNIRITNTVKAYTRLVSLRSYPFHLDRILQTVYLLIKDSCIVWPLNY